MALLTKKTTTRVSLDVDESIDQFTGVAGVDILKGQAITFHTTTGKWLLAVGTALATANNVYIATTKAKTGQPCTGIRQGVIDSHDLSGQNFGASVFLSDTAGELGDAAGTKRLKVGHVVPLFAQPIGDTPFKLLKVNIGEAAAS